MLLFIVGKHSENEKRKFFLAPKVDHSRNRVTIYCLDLIIFRELAAPSRDPLVVVKVNLFLNCFCIFCFYLPTTYIIDKVSLNTRWWNWVKLYRLEISIDSTIIKCLMTFQCPYKFLKSKNRLEKSVQSNSGVNSLGTSAVQYRYKTDRWMMKRRKEEGGSVDFIRLHSSVVKATTARVSV